MKPEHSTGSPTPGASSRSWRSTPDSPNSIHKPPSAAWSPTRSAGGGCAKSSHCVPRTDLEGVLNYVDALNEPHRTMLAGTILREAKGRNDIQTAFAARFSLHQELDRARALGSRRHRSGGCLARRLVPRCQIPPRIAQPRRNPVGTVRSRGSLRSRRRPRGRAASRQRGEPAFVSEWMRAGPGTLALDWILALPPSRHREAITTALNTQARTNPEAALADAGSIWGIVFSFNGLVRAWPGIGLPTNRRRQPTGRWPKSHPQCPPELIHTVMYTINPFLARRRPFRSHRASTDALQRAAAFKSVFATWAQTDVRAAARWIAASPQPPVDPTADIIPAVRQAGSGRSVRLAHVPGRFPASSRRSTDLRSRQGVAPPGEAPWLTAYPTDLPRRAPPDSS